MKDKALLAPAALFLSRQIAYLQGEFVNVGRIGYFRQGDFDHVARSGRRIGTLAIPVIGVLSSAVVLGESFGIREGAALVLVITAVAIVLLWRR